MDTVMNDRIKKPNFYVGFCKVQSYFKERDEASVRQELILIHGEYPMPAFQWKVNT